MKIFKYRINDRTNKMIANVKTKFAMRVFTRKDNEFHYMKAATIKTQNAIIIYLNIKQ